MRIHSAPPPGARALTAVAEDDPISTANARAAQLARGLNDALLSAETPGCAWADASMVHLILGENLDRPAYGVTWDWESRGGPASTLPVTKPDIVWPFRRALLNHGVDLMGMGALVSCVHSEADIDATLDAFAAALSDLRREEIL